MAFLHPIIMEFNDISIEIESPGDNDNPGYVYPDGSVYKGQWQSGKRNGKGHFVSSLTSPGSKCGVPANMSNAILEYNGDWVDDFLDGQGTLTIVCGDIYRGSFSKSRYKGQGCLELANGDIYVGEFDNDLFNGKGAYTYSNGDMYEGDWVNGNAHGKGK